MDEYLVSSDLDVWPPLGFLPFVPERAAVASTAPSAQRAARPVLHAHRLLRAATVFSRFRFAQAWLGHLWWGALCLKFTKGFKMARAGREARRETLQGQDPSVTPKLPGPRGSTGSGRAPPQRLLLLRMSERETAPYHSLLSSFSLQGGYKKRVNVTIIPLCREKMR